MCPGACVIANGGRDSITASCGVTPHAQNTGTSPGSRRDGIAVVGRVEVGDAQLGGVADVHGRAVHGREARGDRGGGLDQVGGHRPHRHHQRARHRARVPAAPGRPVHRHVHALLDVPHRHPGLASARSKVKLQPMRKLTRSGRQTSRTSVGSAASSPSTQTR